MIEGDIWYADKTHYSGQTKETKYRHGKGRYYNAENKLIFEGEYRDNEPLQKYTYYGK